LHARPAALLVKTSQMFRANVMIECRRREVNAKSIMGILTLGAEHGAVVTVTAEGSDAIRAIRAIQELFDRAFDDAVSDPESALGEGEPPPTSPARSNTRPGR
jgi:phosphotransferase system HPr (HPr) family protein